MTTLSTVDAPSVAELATRLGELVGLETAAVGVWLQTDREAESAFAAAQPLSDHRFCQALMKARHGECVSLDGVGCACPAAAAAFGLRPPTPGLQSGKGLVGFGIVDNAAAGARMFAAMPHLEPGRVERIVCCPLTAAALLPDVVVVEGSPEQLMWLLLADLNVHGGERRKGDTAVLQATCVDATIIPYLEQRLNYTLGCYGCREATDLAPSETVVGFPGSQLAALVDKLDYLAAKSIPRVRSKAVYHKLAGE
jgi:uncharacterized protein (DUF169 family)